MAFLQALKQLRTVPSLLVQKQIFLLRLPQLPIFQQLLLEETIYRLSQNINVGWVIFNDYTKRSEQYLRDSKAARSKYSIVLGISGKAEELVRGSAVQEKEVPLIRRFSGGGTVLLSPDVFMVSLILPHAFFARQRTFPNEVMHWSGEFYGNVFGPHFRCLENDYVTSRLKKIGGNAQAFGRLFLVHHTTFLWNVDYDAMSSLLKSPPRQPSYRRNRLHGEFLCGINSEEGFANKFHSAAHVIDTIEECVKEEVKQRGYEPVPIMWEDIATTASSLIIDFTKNHSKIRATRYISLQNDVLPDVETASPLGSYILIEQQA